jgi:hypothetical protein
VLEEIWTEQADYTKSASDSCRQIAFAGLAVVWLFKIDVRSGFHLEFALVFAGICLVASLAADLLQYTVGAVVLHILGNRREALDGPERDEDYERYTLWPMDFFHYSKIALVIAAYVALLLHIFSKLT